MIKRPFRLKYMLEFVVFVEEIREKSRIFAVETGKIS